MKRAVAMLLALAAITLPAHAATTVEVVRSATAEIVIADGRQTARFTDAELRYEDMNLVASVAELDSATGLISISDGVEITTPEFALAAHSCVVDAKQGLLTAEGALRLVHFAEGVTANADRGELRVAPRTFEPASASLEGGVTVEWAEGVTLSCERVEADFTERLYSLEDRFNGRIGSSLLPIRLRELAGGDLRLSGERLFVQAVDQDDGTVLHLTGTSVDAEGERLRLHCPAFAQKLAATGKAKGSADTGMVAVRGTKDDPITGWLAGEDGKDLRFSALAFDRPEGGAPMRLSGDVRVESSDFTLVAPSVEVTVEDGTVRAAITERFRVYVSPEVFASESDALQPEPE
jgi:hypothetical protein